MYACSDAVALGQQRGAHIGPRGRAQEPARRYPGRRPCFLRPLVTRSAADRPCCRGGGLAHDEREGRERPKLRPVDMRQLPEQGEADRGNSPRLHARFDSSPGHYVRCQPPYPLRRLARTRGPWSTASPTSPAACPISGGRCGSGLWPCLLHASRRTLLRVAPADPKSALRWPGRW
jgi:hypothetical protein